MKIKEENNEETLEHEHGKIKNTKFESKEFQR